MTATPQKRKPGSRESDTAASDGGMTRKDLLIKNALVWSSVVLMLGVAAAVAARLTGR